MSMTEPQKESATAFIRNQASKEDILDLIILLEERDSFLKIIELSKVLEQAPRMLPKIRIWENKAQRLNLLGADKSDEWMMDSRIGLPTTRTSVAFSPLFEKTKGLSKSRTLMKRGTTARMPSTQSMNTSIPSQSGTLIGTPSEIHKKKRHLIGCLFVSIRFSL